MKERERHRNDKNLYVYIIHLASTCEQFNSNIYFYKLTNMLFTKSIILQHEMLLYLHCISTINDRYNLFK